LHLDVANLIELTNRPDGSIDENFAKERMEAYKKMYPELEVVGWYQSVQGGCDTPTNEDYEMTTKSVTLYCENPLMFVFNVNSQSAKDKKTLPLFCYEANKLSGEFKQINYSLAASDAEQIAVNCIH
jgi:hypothetical protein